MLIILTMSTGRYKKCIEWSTKSLGLNLEQMLVDIETGETRKLNTQDLEIVNSYLDIINSCIDNNETKVTFNILHHFPFNLSMSF